MSLSELPPGHIGRNGLVEVRTRSSQEGKLSSETPNIGPQTSSSETPSSIQSMLKNTTETGDVGQFSIKPVRGSAMTHQTPKSPSTAQPVRTKKRHVGGYFHEQREGHQNSMHPSSANAPRAATSYHSHKRRSYRGPGRRSAGEEEDERSYSMTQGSVASQNFSHRPYPPDSRRHDQEDLRGIRPRSPYAYPTRLKRPGYRPPSPALSDYSRHVIGMNTGPDRAANFRTTSPLSMYTLKRVPPTWQQNQNRSDPMLRHYAPSPRQDDYGESLQPLARGSLNQLPNGLPSARSNTPTQFSGLSISRRASPSPSPVFYDYTESFEEKHDHNATMSSFSMAEQVVPGDMTKVDHELDKSVASRHLTELQAYDKLSQGLPRNHVQDSSEQPLSTIVTHKATPGGQGLGEYTEHSEVTVAREDDQDPHMIMMDQDQRPNIENRAAHINHLGALASSKAPESDFAPVEKSRLHSVHAFIQNQQSSASNVILESIPLPSLSSEAMHSLSSSSQKDCQTQVPDPAEPTDAMSPSAAYLEIQSIQLRNLNMPAHDTQPALGSVPRGTSFDEISNTTEHAEIYAPTPERAASSLSNRNRFSRILCLDEDFTDVRKLASKATAEAGPQYQDNISKDSAADPSTARDEGDGRSVAVPHSKARVAQATVDNEGPEDRLGLSGNSTYSLNIPAMRVPRRSSSRSLLTALSCDSFEPKVPPRRSSCMREIGYQISERASGPLSRLPSVTENLGNSTAPSLDMSLKGVRHTMKELPPLPREPSFVAYSSPIDLAPPALPFAFTPLIAHQEDAMPTIDVEPLAVPESKQNADSSTLVELSVTASPKPSTDISAPQFESKSRVHSERSVDTQGDQRELSNVLDVESPDIQIDLYEHIDTSYVKWYSDMPATEFDATAESTSKQSLVMPASQLKHMRIPYSAISTSTPSESDEEQAPISKYKLKMRADRDSPLGPQPWDLDDSYPWTNHSPKLEVTMPKGNEELPKPSFSAIPRFKLKIRRASSSTSDTTKIHKQPRSLEMPLQPKINISNDLFRASAFERRPRPSVTIGQENSSQSPHLQTRFKESFERPSATFAISPTMTLVPQSPGLNLEARSFFSDDSSQTRNKGSLKKRLSRLRAMASRTTMSEEGRSFDRGTLRSRASGRISKQTNRTIEGVSHFRSMRLKVVEKVKGWLLRGGEKVRGLWKSRGEWGHTDLYAGV